MEPLGSLPGMTDSEAKGLNDLDHVVGVSLNWRTGVERAFLWRQGDMQELPLLNPADDESSVALSVNVWGQVVGNEQPANSGESVAVLWERNRAFDLNTLVRSADVLDPHITLRSALLINEWGPDSRLRAGRSVRERRFLLPAHADGKLCPARAADAAASAARSSFR